MGKEKGIFFFFVRPPREIYLNVTQKSDGSFLTFDNDLIASFNFFFFFVLQTLQGAFLPSLF